MSRTGSSAALPLALVIFLAVLSPALGQELPPSGNGPAPTQYQGGVAQTADIRPGDQTRAGVPEGGPGGAQAPGAPQRQRIQLAVPPFELSPQQQNELDSLLSAWEASSSKIKWFKCEFVRWEYDPVFGPKDAAKTYSTGEIKFAAPDKGLFHVLQIGHFDPKATDPQKRYVSIPGEYGEHWICNGTSIYEYNHAQKKLIERKLPLEMQGKAISEGPLPFVFGAKADSLKKRYYIRMDHDKSEQGKTIFLEVYPKQQRDAANYHHVELMLSAQDLLPQAINIEEPNRQGHTVYKFNINNTLLDKLWDTFSTDFSRPSLLRGYTPVVEDLRQTPGVPSPHSGPSAGGQSGNGGPAGYQQ